MLLDTWMLWGSTNRNSFALGTNTFALIVFRWRHPRPPRPLPFTWGGGLPPPHTPTFQVGLRPPYLSATLTLSVQTFWPLEWGSTNRNSFVQLFVGSVMVFDGFRKFGGLQGASPRPCRLILGQGRVAFKRLHFFFWF